ncbi:hypothetical protein [Lentzea sp. NPDC060358]|uniref:hypothetical protein n=1 Tax=Lentzea sp. NPDC060358 TaxID=3347103 RepID=UPI0036516652
MGELADVGRADAAERPPVQLAFERLATCREVTQGIVVTRLDQDTGDEPQHQRAGAHARDEVLATVWGQAVAEQVPQLRQCLGTRQPGQVDLFKAELGCGRPAREHHAAVDRLVQPQHEPVEARDRRPVTPLQVLDGGQPS